MKHIYFLGIAGHAMAGLALAAQNRGYQITGLDETAGPPMSEWLTDHQLKWSKDFNAADLTGADAIVISGQHGNDDHPVIKYAREHQIRIMSFAELVGELTADAKVISVAGTHGKTTTTSLITWLLETAGRKPDYLIGIKPFNFDSSSRLDGSEVMVIESDEYKASTLDSRPKFDYYHPNTLVLTAVEHDHPDVYPTMKEYLVAFEGLIKSLPATGLLVACAEGENVMRLSAASPCTVITYGLEHGNFTPANISYEPTGLAFDVMNNGSKLGRLTVGTYGPHNVLNALAATVVALHEGLSFDQVVAGGAGFKGAYRRTNLLTPADAKVVVVDDYAHHPTEVKAMIRMMKLHFPERRLLVVYRPHTFSRTQTLLKEYHQAFSQADRLYLADVEPAREAAHQRTVSSQEIVDGLPEKLRANTVFEADRGKLVQAIKAEAKAGDVVLCMTVSGYDNLAGELAAGLN